MNAAQNNRRGQRDVCRRQDRDEIRQQVQAELRAAGMQPPQQPHIPNEPIQPAPPVYGAIHYEGAVGPHNFDNPLRYFAPNPAPPVHALPEPDYHQFNNQFQHHFQEEQLLENEHIRQAEEAFHQQQLQQQFQQQEAERLNREARRRQRDIRRRQDRDEIRQQAQAELRAAGMQPPQQPYIPNEPVHPAPPAPPVYGAIHYEGMVGPHNFDNPLRYFAPNPAPPFHAQPEPDYHQFNIQFQHHFQEEQVVENERIRNDLLQRQAQEEFHRQQLQRQLQQQEAERIHRQVQDDLEAFQLQQLQARQAQDALQRQQQGAEQMDRQDQDIQRAGQQEEERHHRQQQRVHEEEQRLEEALGEYDDPASQEMHDQDEERRLDRLQREAEDQHRIDQVPARNVAIPHGGRPYSEPIVLHTLGPLNVECPNCHARHFACEKLSKSTLQNPRFGMCCLQGQVSLPPFPSWPPELQQAYTNRTFISKIRQYNSALAFTSVGVNIEDRALQGSGPNAFRIHGSLHHLMGSLIPPEGIQPSYAQLYIYDPEEATNI
ncbi:hypothetical protein BDR05DRAFT_1004682, partial [Suillus weaverae]